MSGETQNRGEIVRFGPLSLIAYPAAAFWDGSMLPAIEPGQVRLLIVLARTGRASHFELNMTASHSVDGNVIAVQISKLRRLLPRGLTIRSIYGWGYELITEGESVMEATRDNSVRDAARRAVERIDEADIGAVLVVIDGNGLPTTYPVGLNMPGRLKALAVSVQTLARETPAAVAAALNAAGDQIGAAANRLLPPPPDAGEKWERVAGEGETCNVPPGSTIRYGAGGRFVTRTVDGPVACSNDVFGDPAVGVVKSCERLASAR